MGEREDGCLTIEFPAITMVRILAGEISATEELSAYGAKPKVTELFRRALEEIKM
jgi:hypothetical protein